MKTQWRKVVGDFRAHRAQIFFIGLVLVLGTAGVVATLNARATLQREIARSFEAARSPDLTIGLDAVEPALLAKVRAHPEVAAADARKVVLTRAAGPGGEWFAMRLIVVNDFAAQQVGVVHRHGGGWEHAQEGLYIEQSSLALLNLPAGAPVQVRVPGGQTIAVPMAGVVHDTGVAPGFQERLVYAYATPTVAARLGQTGPLDQIALQLKNRWSPGPMQVLGELRGQLAAEGATVRRIEVLPRQHPHAMLMNAMLRVLGFLAAMAFVCSSALAAYVVSLWMKREVRQVGIMKAIGATSGQLARQYLALVAPLVLGATILAFPLGTWLGGFLVRYNEVSLNIDIVERGTPWSMLALEAALALLIPFIAMALPILRAARMTAREAMQDPGITAQSVSTSRWRAKLALPGSQEWTLALRNVLRRPWRLTITLLALTAGGSLFLVSNFIFTSLMGLVDSSLARIGYDLQVNLRRPVELAELQRVAAGWKEAERSEIWRRNSVLFGVDEVLAITPHQPRGLLVAPPADSQLQRMTATQGRWPRTDETDAVAIGRSSRVALKARIGDTITIEPTNRPRARVRLVGEFEEFGGPAFYVSAATGEALLGPLERSSSITVKARPGRLAQALEEIDLSCIDARLDLVSIDTLRARRDGMEEHFLGVVGLSNLVAAAAAFLGAISLIAFGCLSVLERAREIGVIRALGATPGRVARLFVVESAVVVTLSSLLALACGLGATRYLNYLMETKALQMAVPLTLSAGPVVILALGVVVVLAGVWLAVSSLVRTTVREALAYE